MLKRLLTSVRELLQGKYKLLHTRPRQGAEVNATRRNFFKKAAFGAASISGTAGVATAVVDSMPKPDIKEQYKKDAVTGEQELLQREYVVMSDEEKEVMVQSLIDSYPDQT